MGRGGTIVSQSRRLAAILAADIAGYSALMGSDEARTVSDLKGHQAVVLPMVGEFGGRFYRKLEEPNWLPGSVITSALVVTAWAAFIWSGSISTIWPMFGIANQLLAAVALCVATTIIINSGRAKYSWVTLLPLSFVSTTTLVAGWESITDIFWPLSQKPETSMLGYINVSLTAIIMFAAVIILIDSIRRWLGFGKRPQSLADLAEAGAAP